MARTEDLDIANSDSVLRERLQLLADTNREAESERLDF